MTLPDASAGPTGEVTELLQQLIRNACVNDGTPESGQEGRNADLLASYLEGGGLDLERYEAVPGRGNLMARIEGSDPEAPTMILMGHTDVVPVNPERWEREPFGGELVDGVVWGRGAVDMLNTTASMAVAFRHLATSPFAPKGTLVYLAVADEEALGAHGAGWLVEHQPDAVRADYVITEFGGMRLPFTVEEGPRLPVSVGEKGSYWCKLRVRGTPGHGSMPLRTDNAVVKAAEVVRRIAEYRPETRIDEIWRRFVREAGFPKEMQALLVDPVEVNKFAAAFPDLGVARLVHSQTHATFAPTIVHGGVKTNVIPDLVELDLDIRTLPGQPGPEVEAMLREALGDLADDVEVFDANDDPSTTSVIETPLWEALARASSALVPGARTVPSMIVGATDARFFRRAGATAYGAGLLSDRISFADFTSMFHGDNERIDQESLRLSTSLWELVAQDLLG